MCASRSDSVSAVMLPAVIGGGGVTLTANWCSARSPALVTPSVTVAAPTASAVSVSCDPDVEASTTPAGETDTS